MWAYKLVNKQRVSRHLKALTIVFVAGLTALPQQGFAAKPVKKKPVANAPANKSAAATSNASTSKGSGINFAKSKIELPKTQTLNTETNAPKDLRRVRPPRSNEFYVANSKEAEYERLLDLEIKKLFQLSQQYRKSVNRGEIWLRLAERYVEKARLIEFREQSAYDQKIKDYLDKKTTAKPVLNTKVARDYNRKAIELYEWFLKDFPQDEKVDQALFFLGYNYFELGQTQKGEEYYQRLVKNYPNSAYVTESYFALGEFYFDNERWQPALDAYQKVISRKKARLNMFALYKGAWCLYRLNRLEGALKTLERVVRLSGGAAEATENVAGGQALNRVRLGSEALKDYVPFYAETGEYKDALQRFSAVAGDEKKSEQMLERLAYVYGEMGNRNASNFLFKQLIGLNPIAEKAADYQYRIVLSYATSDPNQFRQELTTWMDMFGPDSEWAKANAKNQKLVGDMAKLQETVLRNHVLQLHQTAQNSRATFSQQAANKAYALYFKYFATAPQANEMVFYRAELMFDMGFYADAAKLYTYVIDKDPKNKYFKQAVENNVLALEKALPSNKEIESKRGNTLEPIPLDPPIAAFEKGAQTYITNFPKGTNTPDILRRLGVIYYSYNYFDKAIEIFRRVMNDYPGTQNAEIAGNLILDIYKLRGDMTGLANEAENLLKNPKVANSKFGEDIKGILEKASYARADKLSQTGDALKAAKEFESFASTYRQSDLAVAARYKAAKAYEKAGDPSSAIRMHKMILAVSSQDKKVQAVQLDSKNDLARIYQLTGQLELAAKEYMNFAQSNQKDPKAFNAYYNAAILFDSLNEYSQANNAYQKYFDSSKKGERFEVIFAQAEIYRRQGSHGSAAKKYEEYINTYGMNPEHVGKSMYFLAKQAERKGQQDESLKWFKKIMGYYKRTNDKGAVVEYAAEGRFKIAQDVLKDMKAIHFTRKEAQIAQASKQLDAVASRYEKEMIDVVKYNNAKWIVAALVSTAQMFELKANKLASIPFPEGYPADQMKAFEAQKAVGVNKVRNQAKENYKIAHQRAMELESFTDWTALAAKGLQELDPENSVGAGERADESRAMDWMGL